MSGGNLTAHRNVDDDLSRGSSISSAVESFIETAKHTIRSRLAPVEADPWKFSFNDHTVSVVAKSIRASEWELSRHAWECVALARASGEASPSPEAMSSMGRVFDTYIVNDGPTPQVGPTSEGNVEVQWMAAGTVLSVIFDNTGDYTVFAIGPDNSVMFDVDVDHGDEPTEETRATVSGLLNSMSKTVRVRPASFWRTMSGHGA